MFERRNHAIHSDLCKDCAPHQPRSFLLQRKGGCGSSTTSLSDVCKEYELNLLQTKLIIGEPDETYEQEADRVAQTFLYSPLPGINAKTPAINPLMQGTHAQGDGSRCSALSTVDEALSSSGQLLDPATRSFFEPRFGHNFGNVRVHADSRADEAARLIGARAFTAGGSIVFRSGEYAPETASGQRLLAHELTHVIQQSPSANRGPFRVQRQVHGEEPAGWLPELNEILPGRVGLLAHIFRVQTLIHIFGAALLEQHVRLIRANEAAVRLVRTHGVLGIVALYDTRQGDQLDVAAAGRALTTLPDRYRRESLEQLRLQPMLEAPPSFWFQDPASQVSSGAGGPMTTSQRAQVYIEPQLSQVGSDIFVRFAYPASEVSTSGVSRRIDNSKQSILRAIAQVVADIGSLPPAASRQERREQESVRARLREALRGLGSSSPMNVYIATEPTPQELSTGQVAALTDRVFVNLQDVGDPARLQAAIRVPLLLLQGGVQPTQGGVQAVPAASQADLQRILLHEALHALLIRQSIDANAIWEANRASLTVQGSPSAGPQFTELVRKFLIAQEEVFSYENEASLYPPVSPMKAQYELFITNVERFLRRRQLTLNSVSHSIPVSLRVARQGVMWRIIYQVPSGTVDLTVDNIQTLDLLLGVYPLAPL